VAGLIGGIAWKIGTSTSESNRESHVQVRLSPGQLNLSGQF
jgi:hypothetical protein